jgi:beta-glucanase (GH16 family)
VSNTYENFHEYEIKWTPDEIKWLIDGKETRSKKREDTWNETANQWDFPQTPSRVQLSIWPGGADTNLQGTIDWAGGPIDWDSEYIKEHGYYYATFGEIEVTCFDTDKPPGTNKGKSYWYNDYRATNDTVEDGDKSTIIKSLSATGLDMDKGDDGNSANKVPGGGSSGPGQNPGSDGSGGASSVDCSGTSFKQSCDSPNDALGRERTTGASMLAVVVAVLGLMWL